MKRKIFLCVLFMISLALTACKLDEGDDRDSFTKVDVSKFIKSDNNYVFPKETTALELYNTFMFRDAEKTEYNVTGTYKKTETVTLFGKHTVEETKNITKVNIYRSKTEASNRFHVDFIADTGEKFSYCYSWQYHLSNVWNNNKTDGEISITF